MHAPGIDAGLAGSAIIGAVRAMPAEALARNTARKAT